MSKTVLSTQVAIIGAGPAGLMAAEVIATAGFEVAVFDAMPSVGRKLLRAGIGGLNLTHAEAFDQFITRFGERTPQLTPLLQRFGPADLLNWAHDLGIETFVGSSQRVFPVRGKAAPLLRAWLQRLRKLGVHFHVRHHWQGWHEGALAFQTPTGSIDCAPQATVLALGGASWPQLGSTGSWVPLLEQKGIAVFPLKASNCGFVVPWSEHFRQRFARQPIKSLRASLDAEHWHGGELMVTELGLEGGLMYALSASARKQLEQTGNATLWLDLNPARSADQLSQRLAQPQGRRSTAKHWKDKAGIDGVKGGLLREFYPAESLQTPEQVAQHIKALPIPLLAPFAIEKAISSAGGVAFEALNPDLMLEQLPSVFCAGEMLDWEAPTGGYLLTACFASGRVAGQGVVNWLSNLALTK